MKDDVKYTYPPSVPPHICDLFEKLALEVYQVGHDKYSARAVLHRIRWHYSVERGDIHFKVNNNYSRTLARWFLKRYPQLPGFFEIRERSVHNMAGMSFDDE